MKNSLIILAFFSSGIVIGLLPFHPTSPLMQNLSLYALYLLMFLVGIGVGSNSGAWDIIKTLNVKVILLPLSVVIGTLLATGLLSFLTPGTNLKEALAVGSGLGYYSLSSILITQLYGKTLGVLALLANIFRESITMLCTPIFAKYFGKLSPIASGGVTSMDTTLPIITKSIGKEFALISVFNGIVLTVLVPFLVTFILKN